MNRLSQSRFFFYQLMNKIMSLDEAKMTSLKTKLYGKPEGQEVEKDKKETKGRTLTNLLKKKK